MAVLSTFSEPLPQSLSATVAHPAGDAGLHQVSRIEPEALGLLWGALRGIRRRGGTLAGAGARPAVRPALEALSSGGLTLHGTVRAALSDGHDAGPRS